MKSVYFFLMLLYLPICIVNVLSFISASSGPGMMPGAGGTASDMVLAQRELTFLQGSQTCGQYGPGARVIW